MDLGRHMLGEWVRVPIVCTDADGDAVAPTAAPVLNCYGSSDTPVVDDKSTPPFRKGVLTGHFVYEIRLSDAFSAGRYDVLVTYSFSGGTGAKQYSFTVVAGGNDDGAYLALMHADYPHNDFVIGQLDADSLEFRKRPRV